MSEEKIKQLAEAIYQAQWDYRGLTSREEMIPYFEEIIRRHMHEEAQKKNNDER